MSTLQDLVAISFLPLSWWRDIRASGEDTHAALVRLAGQTTDTKLSVESLTRRAVRAMTRAAEQRIQLVGWADPDYPAWLTAIVDPPPVLWCAGSLPAVNGTSVAIVGARTGSPYALSVASRLAADLASRGVVVTSGLARGVDSAAHQGAIDAGGTTLAVLGCGVDVVYPPEHAALSRVITGAGAIVSELAPGTAPHRRFFPRRNRIISGVSRAVVVVEAGEKSGSLITARCALEQGREVLVVPGNVLNGRNKGGHALIRDGAKIVETADDILDELGYPPSRPANGGAGAAGTKGANGGDDPVLRAFADGECCDLDAMAERTGLPVPRLLPRLFDLELKGLIRRAGGGRFIRT